MRQPIFECVGGRWIWRPEEAPLIPVFRLHEYSPVSFPDEETARRLYRLVEASRRVDGRHLLIESTVNEMLGFAVEMCDDRCHFEGWVTRTDPGITGRNWDINWRGADSRTKQQMHGAVKKLRDTVNLLDF